MTDIQHMAFPRAKHSFYARAEFRQHIQRHESLKRTGEAPAVNAERAAPVQQLFRQRQCKGKLLMENATGGDDIL